MQEYFVVLVQSNIPTVILTKDGEKYADVDGLQYMGVINDSCTESVDCDCPVLKTTIRTMLGSLDKDYYQINWNKEKNIMDKLVISFDGE